jgi:hypothetical protein
MKKALLLLAFLASTGCASGRKKASVLSVDRSEPPKLTPSLANRPPECRLNTDGLTPERFDSFLLGCSRLSRSIIWQEPDGSLLPYKRWPEEKKEILYSQFIRLNRQRVVPLNLPQDGAGGQGVVPLNLPHNGGGGTPPPMPPPLPCPNLLTNIDNPTVPVTTWDYMASINYTQTQAFGIFSAHVAQAMYLDQVVQLPWTITTLPPDEQQELLSSPRYFALIDSANWLGWSNPVPWIPPPDGPAKYRLLFEQQMAEAAAICEPADGYNFIRGYTAFDHADLLGATEEQTLANLSAWMRDNVVHSLWGNSGEMLSGSLEPTRQEIAKHTILRDRLRLRDYSTAVPPSKNFIEAHPGCHGGVMLLHDLARSVNIPIRPVGKMDGTYPLAMAQQEGGYYSMMHEGAVFRWKRSDPRILNHADDLYPTMGRVVDFPLRPDGTLPANKQEANEILFNNFWLTPAQLAQWQFVWDSNVTLISNNGNCPSRPGLGDCGYYGGYFKDNLGGKQVPYGMDTLQNPLINEEIYQTCNWPLLKVYCQLNPTEWPTDKTLSSYMNNQLGLTNYSSLPIPVPRTLADWTNRAQACVAAYGGCSGVLTRYNQWLQNKPSHYWVDPPPPPPTYVCTPACKVPLEECCKQNKCVALQWNSAGCQ